MDDTRHPDFPQTAAPDDLTEGDEADEPAPRLQATDLIVPGLLFLATVFTTLWAGAYGTRTNVRVGPIDFLRQDPGALWRGIPYAATLLGILGTHELGHYLYSRRHGVPATLPMFVPGLPYLIGTFGAVIRMRGPILHRRALFDIGVAGPIAGFLVAIPALFVGLKLSTVIPVERGFGLQLGEPLIFQIVAWLVVGHLPQGQDILIHPIGLAAWFGLLVTSLNLLPIGQLDGGHVAYALWGPRQRTMAIVIIPILLVLGVIGWSGWFIWVGLASLIGVGHPPVQDPDTGLGPTRAWIGRAALAIFILSFAPVPFYVR